MERCGMSKLRDAKIFGGIGAILLLFPVVSIVGIVLLFVSVKYIADETKDHDIFKNYLYSFVFYIIGGIAFITIFVFSFIALGLSFSNFNFQQFSDITCFQGFISDSLTPALGGLIGCGLAILIAYILLIIGSLFLRKSFDGIANRTKVDLFKTTGIVYLIGAITTIFVIGFFILLIAIILEIASFFSLPDSLSKTKAEKDVIDSKRRCPKCGRIIPEDAKYCPYCNNKFYE
jgi:uncharacterized membrane protein